MGEIFFKEESYKIMGVCMEVHTNLGMGFKEAVYKGGLEVEFKIQGIPFVREKQFKINYKGIVLPHRYYADFIMYETIILEVKSTAVYCR